MARLRILGKDRVKFLESICVSDVESLAEHRGTLSVFTNSKGGVVDDFIVVKEANALELVVNAGRTKEDIDNITDKLAPFNEKGGDAVLEVVEGRSLLALQGPKAQALLEKLSGRQLASMPFMSALEFDVLGVPCRVTRCGYTGEDGFEISVANDKAAGLISAMTEDSSVCRVVGLGARDTLRLEAGLCLYGHELNEDITPVEAGLQWLIPKRRREEGGFPGHRVIIDQIAKGTPSRRVGIVFDDRTPVREGAVLQDLQGKTVGAVSSGGVSPTLNKPIAMAYVQAENSTIGSRIQAIVRDAPVPGTVVKLPFVPTHYHKVK
jgi:aminomethyltransferase